MMDEGWLSRLEKRGSRFRTAPGRQGADINYKQQQQQAVTTLFPSHLA